MQLLGFVIRSDDKIRYNLVLTVLKFTHKVVDIAIEHADTVAAQYSANQSIAAWWTRWKWKRRNG